MLKWQEYSGFLGLNSIFLGSNRHLETLRSLRTHFEISLFREIVNRDFVIAPLFFYPITNLSFQHSRDPDSFGLPAREHRRAERDRRRSQPRQHLHRDGLLRTGPGLAHRQHADPVFGIASQGMDRKSLNRSMQQNYRNKPSFLPFCLCLFLS